MASSSEQTDAIAIERITSGDLEAVATLFCETCGSRLKYLVDQRYRSLGWQFEELISELFLQLQKNDWKALRDFEGRNRDGECCSLRNYIVLIASNLMAKRIGRRVSEMQRSRPLMPIDEERLADPGSARARTELEVWQAIMQLEHPQDREILILYKLNENSVEEVGTRLGISVANTYTRCSRALKRLRTLLEEDGVHA